MMGYTHAVHGASAGVLVGAPSGDPRIVVLCMATGAVAGLLPDIDQPNSAAGKKFPLICKTVRGLGWLLGFPKHRGITHFAITALGMGVLTAWLLAKVAPLGPSLFIGAAVTAGWMAALLGDDWTKDSLPYLWWPFFRNSGPPRWLRIRTGKWMEKWVIYPASSVALVYGAVFIVTVTR